MKREEFFKEGLVSKVFEGEEAEELWEILKEKESKYCCGCSTNFRYPNNKFYFTGCQWVCKACFKKLLKKNGYRTDKDEMKRVSEILFEKWKIRAIRKGWYTPE